MQFNFAKISYLIKNQSKNIPHSCYQKQTKVLWIMAYVHKKKNLPHWAGCLMAKVAYYFAEDC